ncbi:hypothetical protein AB6A40_010004 [Gnathostoma spinigerum]|uniref:NADH dehydrogenase [ubiquinone] 1 beta subcomplex subunit 2, mitochondrial n=1 Tax=Gnathostoma spinigerum TaxID=75299 RepID=A0ABD6F2K1_9BILA
MAYPFIFSNMLRLRCFALHGRNAQKVLPVSPSSTLGGVRMKWLSREEAVGPNVPVGPHYGNPEDPELHTYDGSYRGSPEHGDNIIPIWRYRTTTFGTTYIDRCVSRFISGLLWFWFTYHMYYHSGHIFGHWYMPYLSEFTDEELGIPPDDAPDPEYWGNHNEVYGTYR